MSTKRLHLAVLILVMVCQQSGVCAEKPALLANVKGSPTETKPDTQLEINKNALLTGPSDKNRINAARVMLQGENPQARKFLLETLEQTENSAARMAVCKALIQAKSSEESVTSETDFIQPLLGMFATEIADEAQLAAEATLIFEYEEIGASLEKIVTDASMPVKTRLNAIYALKLRPDMMATIKLIELVDDPEKQVSAGAESALRSRGMQVGENPQTRKQDIEEIRRQGQVPFLLTQLARQEARMHEIRNELDFWRGSYLTALDKMYDNISEDAAKSEFLKESLDGTEAAERSWALDKAHKLRVAQGKLPDALGAALINLIPDQDRDVRLKTAELLALIPELDSAQSLLDQFEAEQDDQIKMKLFDALGWACSYALLPRSPAKISSQMRQIRKQTLELAAKFLFEESAEKAQIGAEVMKKLLERDGLKTEDVDRYLGLLAKRYNRQDNRSAGTLRMELLSAMAGLCAQGSTYRAKATKLYEPLFKDALRDETDLVRETAVDGLIHVDKTSDLKLLRRDFVNDPSAKLRKKLIDLAGKIGDEDDLVWLEGKIGSNSEGGPAWQAMLKIFDGSDADVLKKWEEKLTSKNSQTKLTNEQKIAFLKIAEVRGATENKPEIRTKLADLYCQTNQFERAADCLGRLYEAAQTTEAKEAILENLVDACMRGSRAERAAELVEERLSKADLDPNDIVVRSIDDYLSKRPPGADPNAVLEALTGIKTPQNRPKWREWLESWVARLEKSKAAEEPQEAVKPEG